MVKRLKRVHRARRAKVNNAVVVVAQPERRVSMANSQAVHHAKSVHRVMVRLVRNVAHAMTSVAAHVVKVVKAVVTSNAAHVPMLVQKVVVMLRHNAHRVNGWIMTNASRCRMPTRCLPN